MPSTRGSKSSMVTISEKDALGWLIVMPPPSGYISPSIGCPEASRRDPSKAALKASRQGRLVPCIRRNLVMRVVAGSKTTRTRIWFVKVLSHSEFAEDTLRVKRRSRMKPISACEGEAPVTCTASSIVNVTAGFLPPSTGSNTRSSRYVPRQGSLAGSKT